MYIIGEDRPIINKSYNYFLRTTAMGYEQVVADNARVANKSWLTKLIEEKPELEPQTTWKLYLGKKLLDTRTTNALNFLVANQKYTLVAIQNGKEVARTTLHTLGGKPSIEVFWQDDYGQKLGAKTIGYLDKVYLKIKTSHIPVGDTLNVTIYEDDKIDGHGDSSRNMATFTTTPVNHNGYAHVYFNNLQVFRNILNKADWVDESEHEYYAKIAYASHLVKDADTIKDSIQLKVKNQTWKLIDPPVTNMPAVVGEVEKAVNETKKVKNLTFGVFIDGTMNNRYDTIARTTWEEKRLKEKGKADNSQNHLDVFATSQKEVAKGENYKYGQDNYENDLSNPAILFDNYVFDNEKVFKVYTEGMGTNTVTKGNYKTGFKDKVDADDYKDGDNPYKAELGGATGQGNSGIIERVKRAIEQTVSKINVDDGGADRIGTITIDVFGFSRGAASARHFVHEIFKSAYKATTTTGAEPIIGSTRDRSFQVVVDDNGNPVDNQYSKKMMPTNGRLGYLLTEKGITIDNLIVRFAGLYDTVAHHGLTQKGVLGLGNDIDDLGLNTISSKAQHIVHMTADDEHRANFNLSRIPKSKNHIELNLPGVHCDVGGSYVEGRPEGTPRGIKVQDIEKRHVLREDKTTSEEKNSYKLEQFRKTLINEGWFTEDQITIYKTLAMAGKDTYTWNYELVSERAYVSNQYSFIPLHLMLKLAMEKKLEFKKDNLIKSKNFTPNIFPDHLDLMKRIQKNINDYSDAVIANPTANHHYHIPEDDLKKLRNRYLHYNATATFVNKPEKDRIRGEVKPSK